MQANLKFFLKTGGHFQCATPGQEISYTNTVLLCDQHPLIGVFLPVK